MVCLWTDSDHMTVGNASGKVQKKSAKFSKIYCMRVDRDGILFLCDFFFIRLVYILKLLP